MVHALEYPIGALTHCSHGEGNGLLLPHVMQYNLPTRITTLPGSPAPWRATARADTAFGSRACPRVGRAGQTIAER